MEMRRVRPQNQGSEVIVVVPENSDADVKDVVKAEESATLKALSPLINSMRIFGLFFLKDNGSDANIKSRCSLPKFSSPSHVYGFAVLVAMWLNTIRLAIIFYPSGKPDSDIIWKCVVFIWTLKCTLAQTCFYRACCSGKMLILFRIFDKKLTPETLQFVRKKAVLYTIIVWQFWTINVVFFAFVNFSSNENAMDILLAPYKTLIRLNPKTLPVLRCLYMLIHVYVNGAAFFPLASNLLLARIFSKEFTICNRKFRESIENSMSFKESFEDLRRQHQMLSRLVSKADKFICFSNAAYVIGLIFLVIANLYNLIWSSWLTNGPTFLFLGVCWLSLSVFCLGMVSFGGIIVNNSAHKIYERIHDINMTNLNAETIGQINTFLNRLTGEPIGFTVLKIFVIDRNAILTILGLLITYFLLIVQLVPPSSELTTHNLTTVVPTISGDDIQTVETSLL